MARLSILLSGGGEHGEPDELCALLVGAGVEKPKVPVLGQPMPGTRGAEDTVTDVVATLSPTVGLIQRIVKALRGWLAVRPKRSIELRIGDAHIIITGYSTDNEDRLVEAFVRRVCERS